MACPHCGAAMDPGALFCGSCGHAAGAASVGITSAVAAAPVLSTAALNTVRAPRYAAFASRALGAAVFLAVICFLTADAVARRQWGGPLLTAIAVVSGMLAAVLLISAFHAWYELVVAGPGSDAHADAEHVTRRRQLLTRCLVFGTLYLVIASALGAAIGKNGSETQRFLSDLRSMQEFGDEISKTRSEAERTVAGQIAMYKGMEATVEGFAVVLARLDAELPRYAENFPDDKEGVVRLRANIRTATRRAELLKKQIAVAKEIEPLDPNGQRWQAWQSRMEPLLREEDALDAPAK